jgi:GTP cyclohydrolase I
MTARPGPAPSGIDAGIVEDLFRQLLKALGQDPGCDDLRDTPRRAAAFWTGFLTPDDSADTAFPFSEPVPGSGVVAVSGIDAWTVCRHHLLPFHVKVDAAYVPAGKIIGLSKIPRIVARHAAALQVQETLTSQVADSLREATGSPAVGVWATGEHLCMLMRGIRATGARTTTQALLGDALSNPHTEQRLYTAARHQRTGAS